MKSFYLKSLFFVFGFITCLGNPPEPLTPFVVGGVEARPHSYPSQVLIIQSYTENIDFSKYSFKVPFCAGTLLNKTHILTAAHCVNKEFIYERPIVPNKYYPSLESTFQVYAGLHDISFLLDPNMSIPSTVKILNVTKIYKHPKYEAINLKNDIALFEITPVEETREIKYAYLPQKSTSIPRAGQVVTVIGWGDTKEGSMRGSNVLLKADVDIFDMNKYCKGFNASSTLQICAGYLAGGKNSCQGDSGGGFYVKDDATNKLLTVGIVSYGAGCGLPRTPAIYTRVSAYMDWIRYLIP